MKIQKSAKLKVPFFRHDLGDPELESIRKVFQGTILTTGSHVAEFESRFQELLGRRFALGVTSATGALHMSLLALGIGSGDEVITTPMTFIATATAILESGARPVFVDVEPDTGNLDAALVEKAITSKTKAILPVHLYGQMCDMQALRRIADRHQLKLIEDAAHCIEGKRDGIGVGQLSATACFSFYATKNLTCGEGGAVVTDDPEIEKKLRLLRLHGMNKNAYDRDREGYQHWDMTTLGWKYNMDNIQAAILLPQLDRFKSNFEKRQKLADRYDRLLLNIEGVRLPAVRPNTIHARHLYPVWVIASGRDQVIQKLKNWGIEVMVNYRAIHLLDYFSREFGYKRGDFPVAERLGDETISLPFYPLMPEEHQDYVAECLREFMGSDNA